MKPREDKYISGSSPKRNADRPSQVSGRGVHSQSRRDASMLGRACPWANSRGRSWSTQSLQGPLVGFSKPELWPVEVTASPSLGLRKKEVEKIINSWVFHLFLFLINSFILIGR